MGLSFADSYFGWLRKHVGNELLLVPAARVVVENENGHILFQKRADTGMWGLPGGCAEPEESAVEVAIRETLEETGLTLSHLEPFGHASEPSTELVHYPQGGSAHFHVMLFFSNAFEGSLNCQDEETLDLQWYPWSKLPSMTPNMRRTVEACLRHKESGQFQLI